jgi:hypothetical protein
MRGSRDGKDRQPSLSKGRCLMGGFLGIGGSSANTDRGNQLAATQGLWNVFNWALPQGQQAQATGSNTLSQAQTAFQNMINPGRAQATLNAAPAVDAALDSSDAARRQAGQLGTSRSGGTAAANANAGATTQGNIDQIINSNLVGGQATGAQGLAGIGGEQLGNASNLLGLGTNADTSILNNATTSRQGSNQINQQSAASIGGLVGLLLGA